MGLLVAFFLISIIFSFLCSILEAVLLSITPSYAQVKLKEGSRIGQQLQSFKENKKTDYYEDNSKKGFLKIGKGFLDYENLKKRDHQNYREHVHESGKKLLQ